jgi:hypothetical protein
VQEYRAGMPGEDLVSGAEVRMIKRRETLDDVTARDVPLDVSASPGGAGRRRP